jgi:predicted nucleic acid-binding protein
MSAASGRFTLDTNLLVYSSDSGAGARHRLALEIVRYAIESECWLTLQSVSEFYFAVTRKRVVPPTEAAATANDWLDTFPIVAATPDAARVALRCAAAGLASYWDALLVATAAEAGCDVVLSEDMADGMMCGGVRIHNPFAAAGGLTEETRRLLGA